MKRILAVLICLVVLLGGCAAKEIYELSYTEGRMLKCNNETFMLIADGSPIILNVEELKNIDKYSDGDLIRIWHDGVEESYPARTKAYKISMIKKGSMADIDENVARTLCDMGWIEYDDMVDRYVAAGYIIESETTEHYVVCEYKDCHMALEIPDSWEYETKENVSECYIRFRPKCVDGGWVTLQYTTGMFGVCGTGLRTEQVNIGGYRASIGYYDGNPQFSFIRFEDLSGEYVVLNTENSSWFGKYEKDIMDILETVVLDSEQPCDNE